jgi:hypothetical protein
LKREGEAVRQKAVGSGWRGRAARASQKAKRKGQKAKVKSLGPEILAVKSKSWELAHEDQVKRQRAKGKGQNRRAFYFCLLRFDF